MKTAKAALLGLLCAGCSYSLDGDIDGLRAEIVDIEQKIPPEAPLWIFDGPDRFDQWVDDRTPRVPDFLYLHLVRKLHGMDAREMDARAGVFDAAAAMEDPGRFRGRFWRIEGLVAELHAEPIRDPKSPVAMIHAGVFFDPERRPVLFHVVQKPDVLRLREDTVETTALFLKNVEYLSRSGRRVTAPLFIGKALRRTL